MHPNLSVYLDLVRFAAAFAVFLGHLGSIPFTKGVVHWRLSCYADLAVIVFFVLSGFVISYTTLARERTIREYSRNRISRIYSVALIAALLTLLCDSLGAHLFPDFYQLQKVLWKPPSVEGYAASLLLVNEWHILGVNGISLGSNAPWWSLSFEFTYYIIAGLLIYLRRAFAIPLTILTLATAGATISALAPVWLLGFCAFRLKLPRIQAWVAVSMACTAGLLLLIFPYMAESLPSSTEIFWLPWGRGDFNRNIFGDYIAGLIFTVHLLGAKSAAENFREIKDSLATVFQKLGSFTFQLYLFHFPVICLLSAISPFPRTTLAHGLFVGTITLMTVVVLTPWSERLKGVLRNRLKLIGV